MDKQLYPDSPIISSGQAHSSIADSLNPTAQIIHLLDRPIAFHRCFVTVTGSITAALMLSQALYWQRRCKNPDGWWYKTRDDWYEETGMGRYEQEGARRKLRQLKVLQEELRGVPAQLWYRVDEPRLLSLLMGDSNENEDWAPTRKRKTSRPVSGKPSVQLVGNQPTRWLENHQQGGGEPTSKLADFPLTSPFNTETTTETTTTTTATALAQVETTQPNDSKHSSGSSQEELIFDLNLTSLSQEDRERTVKALEGLDTKTAQQVLDELNYAIGCGCIKKSKWAWLQSVARSAREGTFIPTSDLADRRQAQVQTAATQPPKRKPSQAWEEHHEELRQDGITAADYHTYITPLRGREDDKALWLEAPNSIVVDWVLAHLPQIEQVMQAHTQLPIRVCIG